VTDALTGIGYRVKRSWMSYAFAALHGIQVRGQGQEGGCQEGGGLEGGADPQRDGMAVLVG
jgi:gamma-glutamyltranspeptidase / glutathione hydrolase